MMLARPIVKSAQHPALTWGMAHLTLDLPRRLDLRSAHDTSSVRSDPSLLMDDVLVVPLHVESYLYQ